MEGSSVIFGFLIFFAIFFGFVEYTSRANAEIDIESFAKNLAQKYAEECSIVPFRQIKGIKVGIPSNINIRNYGLNSDGVVKEGECSLYGIKTTNLIVSKGCSLPSFAIEHGDPEFDKERESFIIRYDEAPYFLNNSDDEIFWFWERPTGYNIEKRSNILNDEVNKLGYYYSSLPFPTRERLLSFKLPNPRCVWRDNNLEDVNESIDNEVLNNSNNIEYKYVSVEFDIDNNIVIVNISGCMSQGSTILTFFQPNEKCINKSWVNNFVVN